MTIVRPTQTTKLVVELHGAKTFRIAKKKWEHRRWPFQAQNLFLKRRVEANNTHYIRQPPKRNYRYLLERREIVYQVLLRISFKR